VTVAVDREDIEPNRTEAAEDEGDGKGQTAHQQR
jgi:hypothetical protein